MSFEDSLNDPKKNLEREFIAKTTNDEIDGNFVIAKNRMSTGIDVGINIYKELINLLWKYMFAIL